MSAIVSWTVPRMAIKIYQFSEHLCHPLPHLVSHLVHGIKQWLHLRIKVGTQFLQIEESWGWTCLCLNLPGWSRLIRLIFHGLHCWFADKFRHFMEDQLWRMDSADVSDPDHQRLWRCSAASVLEVFTLGPRCRWCWGRGIAEVVHQGLNRLLAMETYRPVYKVSKKNQRKTLKCSCSAGPCMVLLF